MERIEALSDEKRHPIRVAATRSGLTPDLLRAWENRYGAVDPGRSEGGQRRYSDRDVAVLRLLNEATEAGRRIGDVAELDLDEVARLVAEDRKAAEARVVPLQEPEGLVDLGDLLDQANVAVDEFDANGLHDLLRRASVSLTPRALAEGLLTPLMRSIGERWAEGEIDPGPEHFATAAVRQTLTELLDRATAGARGPCMVVATPERQRHEIGALLAAVTAATEGWRVVFLGSDLPAEAIASAARRTEARAIAISVVHPPVDDDLLAALAELDRSVGEDVQLYVGGAGVGEARGAIEETGCTWLADTDELREALRRRAASEALPSPG